jgi:hypothetical protein
MSSAVPAGKKVQWVGHSFHIPLVQPVAQLAKEAGIQDHTTVNAEFMGASIPCQHWNRDNGKGTNTVKENLIAGKVDYLTLASREPMPDACIPKFAELAVSSPSQNSIIFKCSYLVVVPRKQEHQNLCSTDLDPLLR